MVNTNMKIMKTIKPIVRAGMFMLVLILSGCYPKGPDYVEDLDIVYTSYDEGFDFKARSTYARPDSIVVEVDIDRNGDTTLIYMKPRFSDPILAEIDKNMQAYGWTKVGVGDDPDILVLPAGTSSTTTYYSWWYDWWYGGWWGWYGWYYPPYYSVGSITTGSLIIVITDPNSAENSPINKAEASWIAVFNGILTSGNNINRVTDGIEQSFEQSPYLQIN